jgi:hypothetical protein
MTRKLVIVALLFLCVACAPTHNVKPLPDFVDKAIQPGDKVIVTKKTGETVEFVVTEVTKEMLVGSLGCSVPILVSLTSDVYEHYRDYFFDACAQHDYCYRHGFRTYGLDREACDTEFLDNMLKACPAPSRSGIGEIFDAMSVESHDTCVATATQFHVFVRRYGEDEFQSGTSTTCHYNGPP